MIKFFIYFPKGSDRVMDWIGELGVKKKSPFIERGFEVDPLGLEPRCNQLPFRRLIRASG